MLIEVGGESSPGGGGVKTVKTRTKPIIGCLLATDRRSPPLPPSSPGYLELAGTGGAG